MTSLTTTIQSLSININYEGGSVSPQEQDFLERQLITALTGFAVYSEIKQGTLEVVLRQNTPRSQGRVRGRARGLKITKAKGKKLHGYLCLKRTSFFMTASTTQFPQAADWRDAFLGKNDRKAFLPIKVVTRAVEAEVVREVCSASRRSQRVRVRNGQPIEDSPPVQLGRRWKPRHKRQQKPNGKLPLPKNLSWA